MAEILVVEDEVVLARSIVNYLVRHGFSGTYAVDASSARVMFDREHPQLVILDFKLNGADGLTLLDWMRSVDPTVQVVMMTGHGDIDIAVRAMKAGARDFLVKPTPLATITAIARELMLDGLSGTLDRSGAERIIGRSAAANALRRSIRTLARAQTPQTRPGVLVIGPRGVGKSLVARALHESGCGAAEAFCVHDCGLHPDDPQAALTALAATLDRCGDCTLLLRHISELRPPEQALLLERLTGRDDPPRVIATSLAPLSVDAGSGGFLPDLLYRIQVGWVDVPPLTERSSDILPIADHIACRLARNYGRDRPRFTSEARVRLLRHDWPGNVAELLNCIERAMLSDSSAVIDEDRIRPIEDGLQGGAVTKLEELERGAIQQALALTGGNVSRAAEMLGVTRDTLRYRIEKFGFSRH